MPNKCQGNGHAWNWLSHYAAPKHLLFCRRRNSRLMAAGWTNESYCPTLFEETFHLSSPTPSTAPLLLLPLRPLKRATRSQRAVAATDGCFFRCQHKGRGGDFPVRSYTKTYKLVIGQLWYIFRLNSFASKFRNKRLEFEVLQNTLHDVFFLHKLIEMWWLPASTILLSLTTRKSRNWAPLKTGLT